MLLIGLFHRSGIQSDFGHFANRDGERRGKVGVFLQSNRDGVVLGITEGIVRQGIAVGFGIQGQSGILFVLFLDFYDNSGKVNRLAFVINERDTGGIDRDTLDGSFRHVDGKCRRKGSERRIHISDSYGLRTEKRRVITRKGEVVADVKGSSVGANSRHGKSRKINGFVLFVVKLHTGGVDGNARYLTYQNGKGRRVGGVFVERNGNRVIAELQSGKRGNRIFGCAKRACGFKFLLKGYDKTRKIGRRALVNRHFGKVDSETFNRGSGDVDGESLRKGAVTDIDGLLSCRLGITARDGVFGSGKNSRTAPGVVDRNDEVVRRKGFVLFVLRFHALGIQNDVGFRKRNFHVDIVRLRFSFVSKGDGLFANGLGIKAAHHVRRRQGFFFAVCPFGDEQKAGRVKGIARDIFGLGILTNGQSEFGNDDFFFHVNHESGFHFVVSHVDGVNADFRGVNLADGDAVERNFLLAAVTVGDKHLESVGTERIAGDVIRFDVLGIYADAGRLGTETGNFKFTSCK